VAKKGKDAAADEAPIAFVAALADGRTCLGCDRDGEWRLTLILPSGEGAQLAVRIAELRGKTFAVVCQPLRE
jgi:hypothetical protein